MKRVLFALLIQFGGLLILHLWTAQAHAEKLAIAVLDLDAKGEGIGKPVADAVTEKVRDEFFKQGGFDLVARDKMKQLTKEKAIQISGCTDVSCAVQIGKALNVRKMVVGSVTRLGKSYTVYLRAIDVEKEKVDCGESNGGEVRVEDIPGLVPIVVLRVAACLTGSPLPPMPPQYPQIQPISPETTITGGPPISVEKAGGKAYRFPPGFTGGRGLYRVISARTHGRGLALSLHGTWSLVSYGSNLTKYPMFQGDSTGAMPDAHHYTDWHVGLSWSSSERLEPSLTMNIVGQADNRPTGPRRYDDPIGSSNAGLMGNEGLISIQDFELAVKAVCLSKPIYAIGFQPFVSLGLSREGGIFYNYKSALDKRAADSSMVAHGFPSLAGRGVDFGGRLLIDLGAKPAQLHTNLGFRKCSAFKDSTFVVYSDTFYARRHIWAASPAMPKRANRFQWGTGVELAAGTRVTFILEGSGDLAVGGEPSDSTSRTHLGGGIRLNLPLKSAIDFGYEKITGSLRPGDPTFAFLAGLSFSPALLVSTKPEPQGLFAGNVRDEETDKPLFTANVRIAELPHLNIALNSKGAFQTRLKPGTYRVITTAGDSFISQERTIRIQDQRTAYVDFSLQRKGLLKKGALTGKVTDPEGRPIASAKVTVGDATAITDAAGIYAVEVTLLPGGGTFTIGAATDGFKAKSAAVVLNAGQTTTQDLTLVPTTYKIKLTVLFRAGKAEIDDYGDIDKAAKLLKDNPEIKAEIGGHTDSRGSKKRNYSLSQKRADAVREAMIQRGGIDSARITAKGYGSDQPVADNKTKVGRAQNRRIEMRVL
jgi:outer membrane protein OmpA-like peptidoglycan-associated protein